MRRLAGALGLLLAAAAPAGASVRLVRHVEATSCGALVADAAHEWAEADIGGAPAFVDLDARAWRLDEPALYRRDGEAWLSEERHRLGDGALRVRIRLAPEAGRFTVHVAPEPAGDFAVALAQYLPGVALPCRAAGSLTRTDAPGSVRSPGPVGSGRSPEPVGSGRWPERAAAVHALLRRATERLYDQRFADAEAALAEAQALAPASDTVRWMRARVAYLEGESLPAAAREGRLAAFGRAERFADEAVALAPERGEGWLWLGVARGRITTTQAGLRQAVGVMRGERGPRFVADCFERAIGLEPEYVHFGFAAAGDARAGAAQLYRLLPSWARPVIGVSRDLDRAVALAREALALQPVRIEYAKELGVALLCRAAAGSGDLAEARHVLRAAEALPARTPYERTDLRHVRQLQSAPPEAACGYSRDAWDAGARLAEAAP